MWNVDIMTGEIMSSIQVASFVLVYWSVLSSFRRGGDKMGGSGYRYFSQLRALLYQSTWKSGATSTKYYIDLCELYKFNIKLMERINHDIYTYNYYSLLRLNEWNARSYCVKSVFFHKLLFPITQSPFCCMIFI